MSEPTAWHPPNGGAGNDLRYEIAFMSLPEFICRLWCRALELA